MKTFKVKLMSKKEITKDTLLLELEKPDNFEFEAGQFIMMVIPALEKNIEGGNQRAMSIASPPYFENLQIVFRKGDSQFKKEMENLTVGQTFEIKGPFGVFTLPKNENVKEVVFLAAGIGITPTRSILLEALKKKLPIKFSLFYSNLRPETTAFLEELQKAASPNFRLICTMTKMEESEVEWKGERGFINLEMLKKYIADIKKPAYYLVGSPFFVAAMEKMLQEAEVSTKNIKLERF